MNRSKLPARVAVTLPAPEPEGARWGTTFNPLRIMDGKWLATFVTALVELTALNWAEKHIVALWAVMVPTMAEHGGPAAQVAEHAPVVAEHAEHAAEVTHSTVSLLPAFADGFAGIAAPFLGHAPSVGAALAVVLLIDLALWFTNRRYSRTHAEAPATVVAPVAPRRHRPARRPVRRARVAPEVPAPVARFARFARLLHS